MCSVDVTWASSLATYRQEVDTGHDKESALPPLWPQKRNYIVKVDELTQWKFAFALSCSHPHKCLLLLPLSTSGCMRPSFLYPLQVLSNFRRIFKSLVDFQEFSSVVSSLSGWIYPCTRTRGRCPYRCRRGEHPAAGWCWDGHRSAAGTWSPGRSSAHPSGSGKRRRSFWQPPHFRSSGQPPSILFRKPWRIFQNKKNKKN